jgi:hypothetical protein
MILVRLRPASVAINDNHLMDDWRRQAYCVDAMLEVAIDGYREVAGETADWDDYALHRGYDRAGTFDPHRSTKWVCRMLWMQARHSGMRSIGPIRLDKKQADSLFDKLSRVLNGLTFDYRSLICSVIQYQVNGGEWFSFRKAYRDERPPHPASA